jgi:shikimate kinase
MNIILIGYRGSGKSSAGKALARRLNRPFVDMDVEIVGRAGMTIKEIFELEGEKGFRDRESQVVRDLAARTGLVIAAGGGAILRPENVAALKASGKIIWLRAPAEVLHQRIQNDAATSLTRPNLTAAGGLEEVRALLAQREEAYRGAADAVVDIHHLSVDALAALLAEIV